MKRAVAYSDSGTVFEAGMCYGLGYRCYCFISDGRPFIEQIECRKGADGVYRDIEGYGGKLRIPP